MSVVLVKCADYLIFYFYVVLYTIVNSVHRTWRLKTLSGLLMFNVCVAVQNADLKILLLNSSRNSDVTQYKPNLLAASRMISVLFVSKSGSSLIS